MTIRTPDSDTVPYSVATELAAEPAAMRVALARLARGQDDRAHALSLLLLLHAAAATHDDAVVELSEHRDGTLVTIEHTASELWIGNVLSISMASVDAAFAELPDLAAAFIRRTDDDGVVLRALGGLTAPAPTIAERPTTPELPSLELLVAAGLAPREVLSDGG